MKKRVITLFLIFCIAIISVPTILFADSSDVVIDETVLEPKDPILATVLALGPGILGHGWGHFYSEDYRMGFLLFGTEIISIGAMTMGIFQNTSPDAFTTYGGNMDESRRAGALTFGVGFALFIGSYLVDVLTAGRSCEQFNTEHGLEFKMQQESYIPSLMYTYKF
jgi:hypothetical protein